MTEILSGRCTHCHWHICLRNLLQYVLENVFDILEAERVADNLSEEELRHVTQNDFLLSHEGLKQDLVDLEVRRPLIADDVIRNGLNKPVMVVVSRAFVLQVGICVGTQTFGVVQFHMSLIGSQHIKCDQVDDCLLPGIRCWMI